jgi:probable rRNA maturation factor
MPVHLRMEGSSSGARAALSSARRFASRMLQALTLEEAELSLLICDDRRMRRLNREHRRIDRSTDVLAFAMREGHAIVSVGDTLGDIAISWPTTKRQAREHGWTPERELCLLLAHGVLHLLGFDHATRRDERRMMARAHMLMSAALRPARRSAKGARTDAAARVDKRRRRAADA